MYQIIITTEEKLDAFEVVEELFEYLDVVTEYRLSEPGGYILSNLFEIEEKGKWTIKLTINGLRQLDGQRLTNEMWVEFNGHVNAWLDRQSFAPFVEVRSSSYRIRMPTTGRSPARRRVSFTPGDYAGRGDEWVLVA